MAWSQSKSLYLLRSSFLFCSWWLTLLPLSSVGTKFGVGWASSFPSSCCPSGWIRLWLVGSPHGRTAPLCAPCLSLFWPFPWLWTWLMLWLLARKLLPSNLETRDTRLTREQLLPGFFFFKIIIINLFYMNKMIRIREVFFYGQNIKWNGKTKKSRKYLLY